MDWTEYRSFVDERIEQSNDVGTVMSYILGIGESFMNFRRSVQRGYSDEDQLDIYSDLILYVAKLELFMMKYHTDYIDQFCDKEYLIWNHLPLFAMKVCRDFLEDNNVDELLKTASLVSSFSLVHFTCSDYVYQAIEKSSNKILNNCR